MRVGIANDDGACHLLVPPPEFGGAATVVQLVQKNGNACHDDDAAVTLPISDHDRDIAAGESDRQSIRDATVEGQHVRILSQPATSRRSRSVMRAWCPAGGA